MPDVQDQESQRPEPRCLWGDPFIVVMVVLFAVTTLSVTVIFATIVCKMGMSNLTEQTFGIRLMQVTLGMLIGLAVTFLGVVVSWFGVKETFDLAVTSKDWAGKLAATGPGVLLVICGTVLIYACIQKEFRITEAQPIPGIKYEKPKDSPS